MKIRICKREFEKECDGEGWECVECEYKEIVEIDDGKEERKDKGNYPTK